MESEPGLLAAWRYLGCDRDSRVEGKRNNTAWLGAPPSLCVAPLWGSQPWVARHEGEGERDGAQQVSGVGLGRSGVGGSCVRHKQSLSPWSF